MHVPISSLVRGPATLTRLMVLGLVLLAGCGGDDPTRFQSIAGRYTLRSVNGSPVPYADPNGGGEYLDGFFDLNADGTWGEQLHIFYGRPNTTSSTGTFALDGTAITLTNPVTAINTVRRGTLDGSTLTVNEPSSLRVYTK